MMGNEQTSRGAKTYNQVKRSRIIFVFSFLILPFIGFLLFYVYVNVESVFLAFQKEIFMPGEGMVKQWDKDFDTWTTVFRDLKSDGAILVALKNTIYFYLSNLLIVFPISLFMAYFFFKQIKGYRVFRFIFYLPCIISSSVLVVLFKSAIGVGGILQQINQILGTEYVNPLKDQDGMLSSLLVYSVLFGFGGKLIVLCGSMNGLNREVMEAGAIDGCNWFQEFYLLVVPMLWPTLSTMITLEAAGFLGVSGPILAFRGYEKDVTALSFILYDKVANVSGKGQNLHYASALGLLMTCITFPLVLLVRKVTAREDS